MIKCTKGQVRRLKTALRWKIPPEQRQRIQMVLLRESGMTQPLIVSHCLSPLGHPWPKRKTGRHHARHQRDWPKAAPAFGLRLAIAAVPFMRASIVGLIAVIHNDVDAIATRSTTIHTKGRNARVNRLTPIDITDPFAERPDTFGMATRLASIDTRLGLVHEDLARLTRHLARLKLIALDE